MRIWLKQCPCNFYKVVKIIDVLNSCIYTVLSGGSKWNKPAASGGIPGIFKPLLCWCDVLFIFCIVTWHGPKKERTQNYSFPWTDSTWFFDRPFWYFNATRAGIVSLLVFSNTVQKMQRLSISISRRFEEKQSNVQRKVFSGECNQVILNVFYFSFFPLELLSI